MLKYRLPRWAARIFPLLGLGLCTGVISLASAWSSESPPRTAPPAVAPLMLRLRTGAYDPLRAASIADRAPAAPDESTAGLYVVQFSGPIRVAWRQALEATGAAILDYLPDFAYLVRATPSMAARFKLLPGHHWDGAFGEVARQAGGGSGASGAGQITRLNASFASIAAAARRPSHAPVLLDVMTLPGADLRAVMRRMPGQILQRYSRRRGFLRVQVAPEAAAQVAAIPGVAWVEPYVPPVLFNDVAGGIMQVPAARDQLGLFGRGQVVAVADTGLDVGSTGSISADFRGRVRRAYALSRVSTGDWSDLNGHGTHVSGSIVGAGVLSGSDPANHRYDGSFAGMAPEARLVMQSVGSASGSLSIPADLGQLFLPPYQNDGVRIHSESWGSSNPAGYGQYLMASWQIDDICWQARDLVIVFADGNGGADANGDGVVDLNSLSPEGAAKNAITVGASESQRNQPLTWGNFPQFPSDPLWGSGMADNPGGMAAFSSRGPTADGRIKPDLVAPGTWILSTRSHAFGSGTLWGAYNADYAFSGGTSMSAPLVAGTAALVREGLQERYGIADPSSAVVKAAFLNGADELAPGQYGTGATREIPPRPNPIEGWGRVDLSQSLGLGGTRAVLPMDDTAGLQTEERRKYSITVLPGDSSLRITLAWTDPPSSMLAGLQLVNDLDLKLLTPDGRWLFGNGGTDRVNNVEAIELPQPAAGVYTVVVDGYNVPQGPQPFAVVVSGPLQPPAATGLRAWVHAGAAQLPLAGADLSVAGAPSLTLTTNGDGRSEARLPVGSYTLTPAKPGWTFTPASLPVTLTDGQMLSVEFAATAATGTLSGILTDRNGKPLSGVPVTLSPGGQTAATGTDGSYQFSALPPLVYTVTPAAQGSAFTPNARRVPIPAGGAARADFTTGATAVSGTVVAAGPVERQTVASAHPVKTGGTQSWTVSRPGAHWIRVHFSRIDVQPGVESVEVRDSTGHPVNHWSGAFADLWTVWVPGSSVTIRHSSSGVYARFGFEIDAVQSDLGGRPVSNAAVSLQPGGQSTQTSSAGSFRFLGLSGTSFQVAPTLTGWQFFPPVATVAPSSGSEGVVSFLAQGPPSLAGQVTITGTTQAARVETLHPYPNLYTNSQDITVPGASRLRLHFQRLATEFGTDFVRLLGPDGTELKRLSGSHTDLWTDWLPASHVTVRLTSDETINDWGYLIDVVASDVGAGGPVAGATMSLSPGGTSTVTGADGTYTLPNLPPGSYTLSASGSGLLFAPATLPVTVPDWGLSGANLEATRAAPAASPVVVAALSLDGQPAVRSFTSGAWALLSQPAPGPFDRLLALLGGNGTPELIALSNGRLQHSQLKNGAWTAWQTLDVPATDRAPVAAAEPDGTLDVLAVGTDGAVLHYRFVNGVWQSPIVAAGVPAWEADRAALVARADGTLELVGVGSDRLPRHSHFLKGAWTTVGPVGAATTVLRPALAVGTDGTGENATLELALVREDGAVLHLRFQAGVWSPARWLTADNGMLTATGAPALAAGPDARLELAVPTPDGVYHGRMKAGSWSNAFRIKGVVADAVALATLPQADPPADLELFATAADGTISHLRFHDGRWDPPTTLAGLLSIGPAEPASR